MMIYVPFPVYAELRISSISSAMFLLHSTKSLKKHLYKLMPGIPYSISLKKPTYELLFDIFK